ncbi:MAG: ABC transporter permease [Bacilli bacterium]|nr:ABC transporter permease [Bacilli bacterium]
MNSTLAILAKKTLRSLRDGWKQFLSIVLIGGIAVTLFIGLLSNAASLNQRVDALYSLGNEADIYVTTSRHEEEDLEKVEALVYKEDAVESRFMVDCLLQGKSSYAVISSEKLSDISISKPFDYGEGQDEESYFLIDKALRDDNPALYSDEATITINISSFIPTSLSNKLSSFLLAGGKNVLGQDQLEILFPITGVMSHPDNVAKASYNSSTFLLSKKLFQERFLPLIRDNYTSFAVELLERLLGIDGTYDSPSSFPGDNQYLVKLLHEETLENKENRIRGYFESKEHDNNLFAITDRSSNPWSIAIDTDVREAVQLTFVFPIVFFFVALLVILTTLSQIVLKERTQIGTLKAIGLTNGAILWHYISLTLVLVGLGSLLGLILGPIIIPAIMGEKYNILYTLPARSFFVFPWWEALLTVSIFLGLSALVTFVVARKSIRLLPAESMRAAPIAFKAGLTKIELKPDARTLAIKMAFRNIRVNLVKSLMVIIGVLGCTALLVCGYGIDDTLNYGLDKETSGFYNADISATYTGELSSKKEAIMSAVPEIKDVEERLVASSTISRLNEKGEVEISSQSSLYFFHEGYYHYNEKIPLQGDSVMISNKLSEAISAKVGDVISFSYLGKSRIGTVAKVFDSFVTHGVFCYFEDYEDLFKKGEETCYVYKSCWIDVEKGKDVKEVQAKLKELSFIGQSENMLDLKIRIQDVMSGVYVMTNAVKVFAILLAIVVLYNLSLLNYRERSRDIATLKVLGFSKLEIGLSLILESLFLTLVGVAFGLLAGYPFMYLVLYVNRVPLVEFLYYVYPLTYVFAFLLSFATSLLVNMYLSLLTDKIEMVESLKSVE